MAAADCDIQELDARVAARLEGERDGVDEKCKQWKPDEKTGLYSFDSGPLLWLTGYYDEKPLTCTENPKAAQQGLPFKAPFPKKEYFLEVFKAFLGIEPYGYPDPKKPRAFFPKTREMLTSWAVMGYGTWQAQWHQWDVVVQTDSEDKAKELVDYSAQLYRNQQDWLRARYPMSAESSTERTWTRGGRVMAIPKGEHKIRLFHPTLYVMDEAAFLPEAEQCYNTAAPVAFQIIAISSAGPGWFGTECSR
jgi:hypothetical protein